MKRPAFQFYPDKWMTDQELRSCSIGARGMWADMLCMAHLSQPYGHITVNGKRKTDAQIVNGIAGATAKLLRELESAGVFSRTVDGTIYSRRMVRDEAVRNARAEGGELGAEHGQKGASHGAKGGRPRTETGDKEPPLHGEEPPPSSGETEPPLKPPPVFVVASALPMMGLGGKPPTVEGANGQSNGGDKYPLESQRQTGANATWPRGDSWVLDRGIELAKPPFAGESSEAYRDRIIKADRESKRA